MAFSSAAFIFGFLPLFFGVYFATPSRFRNGVILLASLLFYSIDGGFLTIILCVSITFNYSMALYFCKISGIVRRWNLIIGIAVNLMPLLYYKYGTFFVKSANDATSLFSGNVHFEVGQILLPAGISFYTFHAISYLVDVYNHKVKPESSLVDFGMYMTNFPQLIAGPIVRYSEVIDVIRDRKVRIDQPMFRDLGAPARY